MRCTAAVALTLLALLAGAPAAYAGNASVGSGQLVVGEQFFGEVNHLQISAVGTGYRITESVGGATGMTAGPGCAKVNPDMNGFTTIVDCSPINTVTTVFVGTGGGDDIVSEGISLPAVVFLGAGNDAVGTGGGDDLLVGGAGDDALGGNGGNDFLTDQGFGSDFGGNDNFAGGAGDDTMDAGDDQTGVGADTFDGGSGIDTVDYSKRTVPLQITEGNGQADDGGPGEHDRVTNAEIIKTGSNDDIVSGAGEDNTIDTGAGNDTLSGNGGNDTLDGGAGSDTLDGGTGADTLIGGLGKDLVTYASRTNPVSVTLDGAADDGEAGEHDNVMPDVEIVTGGSAGDSLTGTSGSEILVGNGGDDTIDGGTGNDTLNGGDGNDTILARDGSTDTISCGPGDDTVTADSFDVVFPDCEHVDLPPSTGTANNGGGGGSSPGSGSGENGGGGSGTGTGPTPTPPGPPVPVLPSTVRLTRAGLAAELSCPAAAQAGCGHGTVTLTFSPVSRRHAKRAKAIALPPDRFSIAAGDSTTVTWTLSRKRRKALKGVRTVTLSAHDSGGGLPGDAQGTAALRRSR